MYLISSIFLSSLNKFLLFSSSVSSVILFLPLNICSVSFGLFLLFLDELLFLLDLFFFPLSNNFISFKIFSISFISAKQ
uniref:Uncharacterized protein n=1 Tax=Meloidogyne enterolobii TaxID=390850 RepID=A0A6V7XS77_MELEN|nr:unnamed protein product [Meloidogyne enterolobii]